MPHGHKNVNVSGKSDGAHEGRTPRMAQGVSLSQLYTVKVQRVKKVQRPSLPRK